MNYKQSLKPGHSSNVKLSLQVLVVDSDVLLLTLMGNILKSLGLEYIHYAGNGKMAMRVMQQHQIDMVISEWPMAVNERYDTIAKALRGLDGHRVQKIPLLVLSNNDKAAIVKNSRDLGINEFLLKPFRISVLCQRIKGMIEEPREFIFCDSYKGPDRRRKDVEHLPHEDRRMSPEKLIERTRVEGNKRIIELDSGEIVIEEKDYSLLRKIGQAVDLNDIFSEGMVKEAQDVLQTCGEDYMEGAAPDLKWLGNAMDQLALDPQNTEILSPMEKRLISIRSKSGMFGFHMANLTVNSLLEYIEGLDTVTDDRLKVMREHLDVLNVVFHQKIVGTGAEKGHKLTHYIQKLKKHHPPCAEAP